MEELDRLVRSAQRGDLVAFDRIVSRFQNSAVGYGYGILGDFHQAQDAAQEAFLQAYRGLPSLSEPAAFPGWLRKIVFKCCDRITRRKQPSTTSLDAAYALASPHADPAEVVARAMEAKQKQEQVRQAVAALPEGERAVVLLFYMGERSLEQTAAFLQLPVTTVKKRLQRARARLKERMIEMVEDTLRENAPGRDTRFVEVANLLRQITEQLEQDTWVVAAYLAHFGQGEGWGPEDDAWSSLNVHVVVDDEHMDALATGRLKEATAPGQLLLHEEAAQNAPAQGYYLMALYDGEAGPYEVDWYWHARSRATIPKDTRLLFDRVGLPVSDQPTAWGYLSDDDIPPTLKRVWAARTEAQAWTEEARNTVSLFWAMLLIAAKHVARNPWGERLPFGGMLRNLLRDLRAHGGQPGAREVPDVEDPLQPDLAGKLALLRDLAKEMEALMPEAAAQGSAIPFAIVPRVYRFLDMVEATLAGEHKAD